MLFKAVVLEALVAATAVSATQTSGTSINTTSHKTKATHTPLSACPGRSRVYEAVSQYSASASFCSSYLPIIAVTHTETETAGATGLTTTVTKTKTVKTTVVTTPSAAATTTAALPRCTPSAIVKRDLEGDIEARTPASMHVPSPLNQFGRYGLSTACHCLHFPTSTITSTVTAKGTNSAAASTKHITSTVTKTVTSTAMAAATGKVARDVTPVSFNLKAVTTDPNYGGNYLNVQSGDGAQSYFSSSDASTATPFEIDSNGQLIEMQSGGVSYIANQDIDRPVEPVYFNSQSEVTNQAYTALDCCVNGDDTLACTDGNNATEFFVTITGSNLGLFNFGQATKNVTETYNGIEAITVLVEML